MKRKLNEEDVPEPVGSVDQVAVASKKAFESFGLDARLLQAIVKEGFNEPTPVQLEAIPSALEGKDIIGEGWLLSALFWDSG